MAHVDYHPLRVARVAGIDAIGVCSIMAWARGQSIEFLERIALEACKLLKLSLKGNEKTIREKSLVKELFVGSSQRDGLKQTFR